MDRQEYAKSLLRFRGDKIPLLKYLGAKWMIAKLVVVGMAAAALFCPHIPVQCGGIFLAGYLLGVIAADLRRYFWGMKRWRLQQELLDWEKIEALAGDSNSQGARQDNGA